MTSIPITVLCLLPLLLVALHATKEAESDNGFLKKLIEAGGTINSDPEACIKLTAADQDEITRLPGLSFKPNFKHYSGFLRVSDTHHLHYWFVTSQRDPCKDPLLFWFNGGPGCSSLDGIMSENGPYLTNPDGQTLRRNVHSWNKMASVVYIESPVGVGFSYSSDGDTGLPDDDSTSAANYAAIKQFFAKFPLFRTNPVFITGESYAGIYEPTLVSRILDGQAHYPINLEGMAIGNGLMNDELDTDTLVRYAYAHGLVGESAWQSIEKQCCGGCADNCNLGQQNGACWTKIKEITRFCWRGGLNVYDLYRDCAPRSKKAKTIMRGLLRAKALMSNDTSLWSEENNGEAAEDIRLRHVPRCLDNDHTVKYLNNAEVRKALNIPQSVQKWDACDDQISRIYLHKYSDMSPFVLKAINAGVRVLLYYGDTDMACNFLGGQQFAAQLGLQLKREKKPWHFNGQIAGFKTLYDKGLTFLTVRGAGHMVPEWRPAEIDYAFQQFLFDRPI